MGKECLCCRQTDGYNEPWIISEHVYASLASMRCRGTIMMVDTYKAMATTREGEMTEGVRRAMKHSPFER